MSPCAAACRSVGTPVGAPLPGRIRFMNRATSAARSRERRTAVLAVVSLLLGTSAAAEVWVEVAQPAADMRFEESVPYIEVRGHAWTGESPFLDVMIAIDLSRSTLVASGSDIDGDGRVGRFRHEAYRFFRLPCCEIYDPRYLSTDLGDTVAHASWRPRARSSSAWIGPAPRSDL